MGEVYVTVAPAVVPGAARILTPESDRERIAGSGRSHRMEGIRDLLEAARANGLVAGRFRGLLHIAIGRTVTKPDGTRLSAGLTWREVATLLKNLRFDPELGREFGADPDTLSPRDRERYWYAIIQRAGVDSSDAARRSGKTHRAVEGSRLHRRRHPAGRSPRPHHRKSNRPRRKRTRERQSPKSPKKSRRRKRSRALHERDEWTRPTPA